MGNLSARTLLEAWHCGMTEPLHLRPLTLLSAAEPETPMETLATLSIGRRDAKLLALRQHLFGPAMNSVTTCPGCGDFLEFNINVADIRAEENAAAPGALSLAMDGYEMTFRLPNSTDLSAVADQADDRLARQMLLDRCVARVRHDSRELGVDEVPQQVIDAVSTRMAEADPQADVQLALVCPVCGLEWQESFDVVLYFWTELASWVGRVLHEVHTLASTYGWHEKDILAMHPWRRRYYLHLIEG